MGEVGHAGEVRAVSQIERRLNECMRLGFDRAIVPKWNLRGLQTPQGMHVIGADTIVEAIAALELYQK